MRTASTVLLLLATPALAQVPSVPGHQVAVYAPVPDPQRLAFDPATGALYVGRDASGSGGGNGDPAKIHRIGPGGSPVVEYGNAAIRDPDAVGFDPTGTASEGAAGSVIVGGVDLPGTSGVLTAVRPDQSVVPIDGPSASYDNPADFALDGAGRVLMADVDTANTTGRVMVVTGSGTPTELISPTALGSGGLYFITVDRQDRIYTSQNGGVIKLFDATGAVVDAAFATGLGAVTPIAAAAGGPFGTELYAVDNATGSLLRLDAQGAPTTIGTGFGTVSDLAFGPDGALYVSEFDQDRVLRIDAPFPAVWDGDGGLTPDQVCPAWTLSDTASPEDPVLAAGVLTLSTSTDGENMTYGQGPPEIAMPDLLVVEARTRLVAGSSSVAPRAPGFIGATTSPGVGVSFFIGPDEIFLTAPGDVKGDSAVVDTDGGVHTYRIVVDGTTAGRPVTVYYDGVATLTGALYADAGNFGTTARIFWGEGSVLASGTLAWESVRHNAAVCTATTTTTSSTSSTTASSTTTVTTFPTTSSTAATTTTSSSPITAPTSTTTTLPAGGCNGIPAGPTFASLLCRAEALQARVGAAGGLGTLQPKLGRDLDKARARLGAGQTACAGGNVKKTRKRVQQAKKAVVQYGRRLRSLAARRRLVDALRLDFLAAGEALGPDLDALRASVACPPR